MNMLDVRWSNSLIILGARDAEMEGIRGLAAELVHVMNSPPLFTGRVEQALSTNGQPVSARDAANGAWTVNNGPIKLSDGTPQPVVLVELTPNELVEQWRKRGHPILIIDHHSSNNPQSPSIHQVAALLLGGFRAWLVGVADHDLALAYATFPEETFEIRREAFGWTSEDIEVAKQYVQDLDYQFHDSVGVGVTPSPNNCVADLLIKTGKAAIVPLPQSDKPNTQKFVLIGATSSDLVERLLQAAKTLGWESYGFPNRGIGGIYVPDGGDISELMSIL